MAIFLLCLVPPSTEAARPSWQRTLSLEATRAAESAWILSRHTARKVTGYLAQVLVDETLDGVRRETSRPVSPPDFDEMEAELEDEIADVVAEMKDQGGSDRTRLQETVEVLRSEIELIRKVRTSEGEALRALQREQERLVEQIDDLERELADIKASLAVIEDQLASVETYLIGLERERIRDCLDLVDSRRLGIDGYPVSDRPGNLREGEGRVVGVDAWASLYLDSCSPDLIERGLLIQSALVAHDVEGELSMWVTVSSPESGASQQFEYFLGTPLAPVDGQVREFFLPYDELPVSPTAGRTAVAVVLTLGGKVVYQLPPRAFSCSPGAQIDCVWR